MIPKLQELGCGRSGVFGTGNKVCILTQRGLVGLFALQWSASEIAHPRPKDLTYIVLPIRVAYVRMCRSTKSNPEYVS